MRITIVRNMKEKHKFKHNFIVCACDTLISQYYNYKCQDLYRHMSYQDK